MQGRYLPLPVVYHKDYDTAKRAFILYHQLYIARALVYVILMLLPFFEVRLGIQFVFPQNNKMNAICLRHCEVMVWFHLIMSSIHRNLTQSFDFFRLPRYLLGVMKSYHTPAVTPKSILWADYLTFTLTYLLRLRYDAPTGPLFCDWLNTMWKASAITTERSLIESFGMLCTQRRISCHLKSRFCWGPNIRLHYML